MRLAQNLLAVAPKHADHFANFTKAVRSRNAGELHADILEGHLSSALCHLGNISYRLGREVPFDSQEVKALACDIRPGRRPTGPGRAALVREYQRRAGITGQTGMEV